jgi:hypothetical protein
VIYHILAAKYQIKMRPLRAACIAVLFFVSFYIANAQKITTALELSNYFSSVTDSMYKYGQQWGNQFSASYNSKKFGTLTSMRAKIEDYTSSKIVELTAMKDVSGSENFRAAMLDFLSYEKKMIKVYFAAFEKLDSSSTDDDIQKHMNDLIAVSKDEEVELQKVREAQQDMLRKMVLKLKKEVTNNFFCHKDTKKQSPDSYRDASLCVS